MHAAWDTLLQEQAGRLSRQQAIVFGVTDRTVDRRMERDGWRRPLPGVIAVDDRDPDRARLWEPKLYAGSDAVIDWPLAGRLLEWDGVPMDDGVVPLAILEQRRVAAQPGMRVRRTRRLAAHAVRLPGCPPLLAVPELLLEAAADVSPARLRALVDSAFFRKHVTADGVRRVIGPGGRGCAGARPLAAATDTWRPGFEAIAEHRFSLLMLAAGVDLEPQPTLHWADGRPFHPDFGARDSAHYFEIDSQAHHSSPAARREDKRRDKRIKALRADVQRIEGTDVLRHPGRTVREALDFIAGRAAA